MASRSDIEIEAAAAYDFMVAVRKVNKRVLTDLRNTVPPDSRERRHGSVLIIRPDFTPELMAWAERWHLATSKPILRWAKRTTRAWAHDETGDRLRVKFTLAPRRPIAWGDFADPALPELQKIGAEPDFETRVEFLKRAKQHYDARRGAGRQPGRKGEKTRHAHYEWLAWRLFHRMSYAQIATKSGASKDAVRKGIKTAAAALRLSVAPYPPRP